MFWGLYLGFSVVVMVMWFNWPPPTPKPRKPPMSKLRAALWVYGVFGVLLLIGSLTDGIHH